MQFHTEAEKGQCQNFFEIQKKFESQYFLEIIFEQFIKSETLLQIFIILIHVDPQIFFTNPKLVYKSTSLHQILKNILEIEKNKFGTCCLRQQSAFVRGFLHKLPF